MAAQPDRPSPTVRLAPLAPREWPPAMREALAPLTPKTPREGNRPKGLNVLGLLAHHPELTRSYHVFVGYLLNGSTLTPRQRELVILRVAHVRGAEYEWTQHVVQGLDAGLTDDEVRAVRRDPADGGWSAEEAGLLAAVDELIADGTISDATWQLLAAGMNEQQLLDMVFTAGAYEMLAMVMQSFGVEMDADLQPWQGY